MKISKSTVKTLLFSSYFGFVIVSFLVGFEQGKAIGHNFFTFSVAMLKLLPCAFILIGLFEVWVKKESVEKHLGRDSNLLGFLWVVLLAGTTVGGLYVAFPVAYSLFKKGAKLTLIFTYVGAAAVCRAPMMIFEASFMGVEFTIVRLLVSIPLVILTSILLGNYLEKHNYELDGESELPNI